MSGSSIENREKQGVIGEALVKDYYEQEGYKVYENSDKYGVWDLIVASECTAFTVQVKTMVRYITKDRFTIKEGPQKVTVDNAISADKLIIVCRHPHPTAFGKDSAWGGQIIEVQDHRTRYRRNTAGDLVIPSNHSNLHTLAYLEPDESELLRNILI